MMISRLPFMSCSLVIFGAVRAVQGCGYCNSGLIVLIRSPMRNILGALHICLHNGPEQEIFEVGKVGGLFTLFNREAHDESPGVLEALTRLPFGGAPNRGAASG